MGGGSHKPECMLVTLPFPKRPKILDTIQKNHPNIQIIFHSLAPSGDKPPSVPKESYRNATVLVTLGGSLPQPQDCPRLGLIHLLSAGINQIVSTPIYSSTSIPITTSSGIHGPQIAEWVVLTSLAHSHHYPLLHTWQTQHQWGASKNSSTALGSVRDNVGLRLGVLGYGSIGRQCARIAKAMGMDVIAYTASPRTTKESKKDAGFIVPGTGDPEGDIPSTWYSGLDKSSLHNFLRQDIDHLLISVPLTPKTHHLLSAPEFEILGKRNAFVSNISRGPIIQQTDLIAALKRGVDNDGKDGGLGGAALDVTDPEPLPKDDPLWDAPNVIITPHVSGTGTAYVERAFQVLELNLDRREKGEKMINVVDRERGY